VTILGALSGALETKGYLATFFLCLRVYGYICAPKHMHPYSPVWKAPFSDTPIWCNEAVSSFVSPVRPFWRRVCHVLWLSLYTPSPSPSSLCSNEFYICIFTHPFALRPLAQPCSATLIAHLPYSARAQPTINHLRWCVRVYRTLLTTIHHSTCCHTLLPTTYYLCCYVGYEV